MTGSSFLGKYQILGELGKGGFATVYRARDPDLGRDVALKVLDPLLTRDPVWVARFRREARAVASLDHPRVVTVHEIGQAEGSLYIAMKLVEGGSLAQHIAAQGALPWDEVVRLAGQIAEALDFAHGQRVLHRDLKPANVLLDARLGAVLSDFGFASLVADNSLSISMSGGVVGTPAYIAPEVWEGDDPTPQTDIYALGCIVYELVSGQALFGGNSTPAVMRAHFQPRKLPETWPEGTPPGLNDVLLAALAQEPAERNAAAGELSAALAGLHTDPLAEPYAQLQRAVEAGRWQEALALAAQVRAADAGYRDVVALEAAAQAGLREEQLAAPYGQLQAAVEGGRWQEALALAGQVRAVDASYRDVVALEAAALAGLEQEARAQQAVEWRAEAERALAAAEFRDAGRAAQKWQELTPGDPELADFRQRLAEAQARPTLTEQPSNQPAAPSPEPAVRLASDRSIHTPMDATSVGGAGRGVLTSMPEASQPPEGSPRRFGWLAGGVAVLTVLMLAVWAMTIGSNQSRNAAPTPTPTLGIGSTMISEIDGMEMVYVPAGEFLMGSREEDEWADDDEKPQHTVYLDGFWIDKTEVTNAMFVHFAAETGHQTNVFSQHPQGPSSDMAGLDEHPVAHVNWNDATAYCQWAGRRLPTEAEWEKAARGTDGAIYPWGNAPASGYLLNYADVNIDIPWADKSVDDGYQHSAPVGSYLAGVSPYGALDVAGNVWEWVADWYDENTYTQSPNDNPTGPGPGSTRVLRGGSWLGPSDVARAAYREGWDPDTGVQGAGFRCAHTP